MIYDVLQTISRLLYLTDRDQGGLYNIRHRTEIFYTKTKVQIKSHTFMIDSDKGPMDVQIQKKQTS